MSAQPDSGRNARSFFNVALLPWRGDHARRGCARLDILASSRRVRIVVADQAVAESSGVRMLFETGLPTRYYLPKEDVRMDLLEPSDRRSACPYKGTARHWLLSLGDERIEDLVWAYPEPVAEAARIKDYLCFFNERVQAIFVDGEEMERPVTKWPAK